MQRHSATCYFLIASGTCIRSLHCFLMWSQLMPFVTEVNDGKIIRFCVTEFVMWRFASFNAWTRQFFSKSISKDSAGTHLRCSGNFSNHFSTNLLLSVPVTEFWKLVKIWQQCQPWVWCLPFLVHSVVITIFVSVCVYNMQQHRLLICLAALVIVFTDITLLTVKRAYLSSLMLWRLLPCYGRPME